MHNAPLSNVKAVVLDFDGTLADTRHIILTTMHASLLEMHLPDQSDEACAATIGLPLDEGMRRLVPGGDQALGLQCAETYRRLFTLNNRPGMVKPFAHVADTLRLLHSRGLILTVASSRHHESLAAYLDEFGLTPLFSLILGVNDVAKGKPDPEPVLHTLRAINLHEGEAVVVGDTAFDILMGARAHCPTVGVTYGNAPRKELEEAGADHIIDDFSQLASLIG